jgi:hypothetical protein
MSGLKAQYYDLTLLAVSEFNEWRVMLYGPATTIQGAHSHSEAKAKENALTIARYFVHEHKHSDLPVLDQVEWVPTSYDDWLVWTGRI